MTDTLLPPTRLTVVVRERRISNRVTILDIEYDGSQPPSDLFAELRALGWEGAVPTSPRADVIDWRTPDPVRGTAYSVLPHVVVIHATLQADVETCPELRRRTQAILARHGFADVDVDAETPAPARTPAPAPAPTVLEDPGGAIELVDVLSPLPTAAAVELVAAGIAEVVEREDVTEVVESTFRGNVSQTAVLLRRLRLRVAADRHDELVSLLSIVGVRRIVQVR